MLHYRIIASNARREKLFYKFCKDGSPRFSERFKKGCVFDNLEATNTVLKHLKILLEKSKTINYISMEMYGHDI